MDSFAVSDLFAVTNLLLVICTTAMPEDHIRITDINCSTLPRGIKLQIPSVQECDNGYYLQCTGSVVPVKRICPLQFWWNPYNRMKFDRIKRQCVQRENIDCRNYQLKPWINHTTRLIQGDKKHLLDFGYVGVVTADPSTKCPISVDCSKFPVGKKIPIPSLDECNSGYYCECEKSGLTLQQCTFDSIWSLTYEKFDPDLLKCVNSNDFDCAKWIQGQSTPISPVTVPTTHYPLTSVRTLPVITTNAPTTFNPPTTCPISIKCDKVSIGKKIPIPILDECNNGYYCECDDSGLTLQQCTYDSIFSFAHKKLNPDTLQCVESKDFDCSTWINGQTTPVTPVTDSSHTSLSPMPKTSHAVTTNSPATFDPSKGCPILVDCSSYAQGRKIPIPILFECNNGYYCECDDSGLTLQQCTFDSVLSFTYEKLDPYSLKCVKSKDFDCEKWIQGRTTPVSPVTGSMPTNPPPISTTHTSPAVTTNVPTTFDPSKGCPIPVDCSSYPVGQKIPIPILFDCNNGYYCECDDSGLTLQQCTFDSVFSFTYEKLDPYSLKCVKSKDFDCEKWIQGRTTPVSPVTGSMPTNPPPISTTHTSPAVTTNVPTTFDPSKGCPIPVDCSSYPQGRKIPIPISFECNNGYYCECDDSGLTLQQCTFDSVFSFTYEKLDPYSLKCVKSKDFDCEKWIQGRTTPVSPVTGSMPTSPSPISTTQTSPAVTTNVPTTFDPSKGCPIPLDCSSYPVKQKIPIPILFECNNGYYCECDDSGLTLQQCTFDSVFSFTYEKLDPYSLKCVKSKDFDCEEWIQGRTTPRIKSTTHFPLSTVTTNAPTTFNPSEGCPIQVDCGQFPVGQKIPIPILDECNEGFYCVCEKTGLALQQCSYNGWFSHTRKKLDPYKLKCVKSNDFDCATWINDLPSTTHSPCASEGCTTRSHSSSSSSLPFRSSAGSTVRVSTPSGSPFLYSSTSLTIATDHPEGSTTASAPDRPTPVPELSSAHVLSASFSLLLLIISSVLMIHVRGILILC